MTKLEDHLEGVIDVFHQYSAQEGHQDTLSKGEMKKLMMGELPNCLKAGDELLIQTCPLKDGDLDADKHGVLPLDEFLVLLGRVLVTRYKNIHKE
uniref:S100/CaBP-9k-type calcium binding subdomain domain-containing protein n=1 Tax=Suricata suricatta TaxID=37032 RepID=A0A673U469_SURSU